MPTDINQVTTILTVSMIIVLISLIMVIVLIRFVRGIMKSETSASVPALQAAPVSAPAAPAKQAGNEVIAAISAAVAMCMADTAPGVSYEIKSIAPAARSGSARRIGNRPAWGYAGMRQNTEAF